jgi:hypothetical protein
MRLNFVFSALCAFSIGSLSIAMDQQPSTALVTQDSSLLQLPDEVMKQIVSWVAAGRVHLFLGYTHPLDIISIKLTCKKLYEYMQKLPLNSIMSPDVLQCHLNDAVYKKCKPLISQCMEAGAQWTTDHNFSALMNISYAELIGKKPSQKSKSIPLLEWLKRGNNFHVTLHTTILLIGTIWYIISSAPSV